MLTITAKVIPGTYKRARGGGRNAEAGRNRRKPRERYFTNKYSNPAHKGAVGAEPAFSGTSWTALTLEVGKSPTEVTCGRHARAQAQAARLCGSAGLRAVPGWRGRARQSFNLC